jgi:hypothetical protein
MDRGAGGGWRSEGAAGPQLRLRGREGRRGHARRTVGRNWRAIRTASAPGARSCRATASSGRARLLAWRRARQRQRRELWCWAAGHHLSPVVAG